MSLLAEFNVVWQLVPQSGNFDFTLPRVYYMYTFIIIIGCTVHFFQSGALLWQSEPMSIVRKL